MPVAYRIDAHSGVVLTTATGIVTFQQLAQHIAAKSEEGYAAKAELFDARDITLDLSVLELKELAERAKAVLDPQAPGQIAVVTNSGFVYGLARTYAELSRADNPHFEVFSDVQ